MKLQFGYDDQTFGTIEDAPEGLRLQGDVPQLERLVQMVAYGTDPADAPGGLPGFMDELARQLNNGYLWCRTAPETAPETPSETVPVASPAAPALPGDSDPAETPPA